MDRLLTSTRLSIYLAIDAERERQNTKFPDSNIPHWQDADGIKMAVLAEELGEVARAMLEGDRAELRKELAQVAAVAVAWLEALDAEDAEQEARYKRIEAGFRRKFEEAHGSDHPWVQGWKAEDQ